MKRTTRGRGWVPAWAALLVVALLAGAALAADPPARKAPTRRPPGDRGGATVKVGQDAPDFEIAKLTLEKNDKGVIVGKISKEKVKLSSHEGKQIVCIFSSSYT